MSRSDRRTYLCILIFFNVWRVTSGNYFIDMLKSTSRDRRGILLNTWKSSTLDTSSLWKLVRHHRKHTPDIFSGTKTNSLQRHTWDEQRHLRQYEYTTFLNHEIRSHAHHQTNSTDWLFFFCNTNSEVLTTNVEPRSLHLFLFPLMSRPCSIWTETMKTSGLCKKTKANTISSVGPGRMLPWSHKHRGSVEATHEKSNVLDFGMNERFLDLDWARSPSEERGDWTLQKLLGSRIVQGPVSFLSIAWKRTWSSSNICLYPFLHLYLHIHPYLCHRLYLCHDHHLHHHVH